MNIEAIIKCSCGAQPCEYRRWVVFLERRGDRLVWWNDHQLASQEDIEDLPYIGEYDLSLVKKEQCIPYEELPLCTLMD